MIHPLASDFSLERYGLKVRLATEADTSYIMSLRTDPELSKFIHKTDNDIQKHLEWFRKYKQREAESRDYYFIYFKGDRPVGLNRIYNVYEYYGTIGSWLCSPDNEVEVSISTHILLHDIIFEILGLELTLFDVRKGNKKVWKLHEMTGAKRVGESDIDFYYVTTKNEFINKKDSLVEILGMKEQTE